MSQGEARPLHDALAIAERLRDLLAPACERIEIAGSIRRRRDMVRDIELVAVARWEDRATGDLWATSSAIDVLEDTVEDLLLKGTIQARQVENHRSDGSIDLQTKLGPAFKALVCGGIPVDLFVVRHPATWGCIFALRTGPGDWNTRLVMDCQAIGRRVEGGQVVAWHGASDSWRAIPTPEERDFFAALGQPWVEPPERSVERVAIRRSAVPA